MPSNHDLLEIIERLGNLLRVEKRQLGKNDGLQPVHIQALDYLSRCNPMSDTPLALSRFLGISKGTTSQSILVLENKALIRKLPDQDDRRVVHLRLTAKGKKRLSHFSHPGSGLNQDEEAATAQALAQVLKTMIKRQDGKSFGVCRSCRHFRQHDTGYHCGLVDIPLKPVWIDKICHEHQYP